MTAERGLQSLSAGYAERRGPELPEIALLLSAANSGSWPPTKGRPAGPSQRRATKVSTRGTRMYRVTFSPHEHSAKLAEKPTFTRSTFLKSQSAHARA
jgi:hypothetical protein